MAEKRQKMRDTTANLDAYVGLLGQICYDYQRHELRIFNGVAAGGTRIPTFATASMDAAMPPRLAVDSGAPTGDNLNNTVQAGFYRTATTTSNQPVAATQAACLVIPSNVAADGDVTQIWVHGGTANQLWTRNRKDGVWSTWARIPDSVSGVAFNATNLNGQPDTYYTNIIARLGYTPVNKAGDTMGGNLSLGTFNLNAVGTITTDFVRSLTTTTNTLGGTTHGWQTGPTAGLNVIYDVQGIQARNNGVASQLNLNALGGRVSAGGASSFIFPSSAAPTPTAEGDFAWDSDDDIGRIGNGTVTRNIPSLPNSGYTDNEIPRFDGTVGNLQGSGATMDDSQNLNISGSYRVAGSIAWVSQGFLKVTDSEQSTTAAAAVITLPGGLYGFEPCTRNNVSERHVASNNLPINAAGSNQNTSNASTSTCYYIIGCSGGGGTQWARQQYIQASPPYDLGDGVIPLFVWALIEKGSGNIISTQVAQEAPWHNNGPTSIRPDHIDKHGKKWKVVRRIPKLDDRVILNRIDHAKAVKDLMKTGLSAGDAIELIIESDLMPIEIDQSIKQADMGLIPHPWISDPNFLEGKAIPVLVDPVCDLMHKLADWHEYGESITDLIHENGKPHFLKLGNEKLKRAGPSGVMVVHASWK